MVTTELAAVVDLERQTKLPQHSLAAIEDAARADLDAFRAALDKVSRSATRLREQAERS